MLLLMLESGMPIDCVITADTGMEFPEMYRHWDKLDQLSGVDRCLSCFFTCLILKDFDFGVIKKYKPMSYTISTMKFQL